MTETLSPAPAGGPAPVVSMRGGWLQSITRPIQAFQLNYVPVVMVYFAYGALGLIDVTRDLWIKESLSLTPSQLAGIGVWLTLPWTVKMVFGELVDTVPIFGSQRKSYIIIGALLMVAGLVILAGAAGRWLTFTRPDNLYVLGAMLLVIGTVVQDVVADAMSTEVVPRHDAAGNERPDHKVRTELGMVQVLGRLAVSAGVLAVAGLSGWLANFMRRQDVFLIGLIIPAISVAGVFLRGTETKERRPIDWRILGGGIAFWNRCHGRRGRRAVRPASVHRWNPYRKTPTYSFPSAAGQSAPSDSIGSSSASGRPPRCHSRSTRTCFAMPVGSSSPTTVTIRGPCSTTSGTGTFNTPSGTPKWRPTGSRTFGGADAPARAGTPLRQTLHGGGNRGAACAAHASRHRESGARWESHS